jgi:hypothetical protein
VLSAYRQIQDTEQNIDPQRAALLASTALVTGAPVNDVLEGYRTFKSSYGNIDNDRAAILTTGAFADLAGPEAATIGTGAWLQQELRRREDEYPDVPDYDPYPDPGYPDYPDPGYPDTGPGDTYSYPGYPSI